MAIAVGCVEKDLSPGEPVFAYGYAVTQLYSISVYDKELYEATYLRKKRELDNHFPAQYAPGCREMSTAFPVMTDRVLRQYAEIRGERQASLAEMSKSAASFGATPPKYYQSSVPPASSQVNIGLPERKSRHYLVDFGGSQRQCTVSSSGYVFCN